MAKKILITGGAGFIGSNYACRRILNGDEVSIFDNLSRDGAKENLKWITNTVGKRPFQFIEGDVRDLNKLKESVIEKDVIVHLAAQVAVTSSVDDPQFDFDVNAGGTFNLLEAARQTGNNPIVIYASTNKVYGKIDNIEVVEEKSHYSFSDLTNGISEKQPLNFHSPYKAVNIIEFWHRWHMTLSRFLMVYVYFPLGGNRKGQARRYVNLMSTMVLVWP